MNPQLNDLRLLHLAQAVEDIFEGLEKAFERHLPDGAVKATLKPLFLGGPNHHRLEEAYARLNRALAGVDVTPDDLLDALLLCERTAQNFYLQHAKELQDPALARLFEGMAAEEGQHLRAVQEAQRLRQAGAT